MVTQRDRVWRATLTLLEQRGTFTAADVWEALDGEILNTSRPHRSPETESTSAR
jgi:hypothetical protein